MFGKGRRQDNTDNAPDVESTNQDDNTKNLSNNSSNISADAKLSKLPRDLHVLLEEYEYGLEDCKVAKDFNDEEACQVNSTYRKGKGIMFGY